MSQLKPCPFCGEVPQIQHDEWRDEGKDGPAVYIVCRSSTCWAEPSVMGDTEESAAAFWNTRAVVVTDEMVEILHAQLDYLSPNPNCGISQRALRAALEAALGVEGE